MPLQWMREMEVNYKPNNEGEPARQGEILE